MAKHLPFGFSIITNPNKNSSTVIPHTFIVHGMHIKIKIAVCVPSNAAHTLPRAIYQPASQPFHLFGCCAHSLDIVDSHNSYCALGRIDPEPYIRRKRKTEKTHAHHRILSSTLTHGHWSHFFCEHRSTACMQQPPLSSMVIN